MQTNEVKLKFKSSERQKLKIYIILFNLYMDREENLTTKTKLNYIKEVDFINKRYQFERSRRKFIK